jgi:hypothetical protein
MTNIPEWLSNNPRIKWVDRDPDPEPIRAEYKKCKDCGCDIPYKQARCKPCEAQLKSTRLH